MRYECNSPLVAPFSDGIEHLSEALRAPDVRISLLAPLYLFGGTIDRAYHFTAAVLLFVPVVNYVIDALFRAFMKEPFETKPQPFNTANLVVQALEGKYNHKAHKHVTLAAKIYNRKKPSPPNIYSLGSKEIDKRRWQIDKDKTNCYFRTALRTFGFLFKQHLINDPTMNSEEKLRDANGVVHIYIPGDEGYTTAQTYRKAFYKNVRSFLDEGSENIQELRIEAYKCGILERTDDHEDAEEILQQLMQALLPYELFKMFHTPIIETRTIVRGPQRVPLEPHEPLSYDIQLNRERPTLEAALKANYPDKTTEDGYEIEHTYRQQNRSFPYVQVRMNPVVKRGEPPSENFTFSFSPLTSFPDDQTELLGLEGTFRPVAVMRRPEDIKHWWCLLRSKDGWVRHDEDGVAEKRFSINEDLLRARTIIFERNDPVE